MLLIVLLVAVPTFEVWLLVSVARQIGGVALVAILVAEVLVGAWLMRREGSRAWTALTAAFSTGRVPSGELADAALILAGGMLLMLPGFVTDLVGFLFLLPLTRPLARHLVAFFIARRINRVGPGGWGRTGRGPDTSATVIPGETVPDGPSGPTVVSGEITDGPPTETGPSSER